MTFKTESLYATYGEGMVLRHVDLEAPTGRITCLVGRNGAGKTTTMKAIMGLVKTPEGSIQLDGEELIHLPAYERARRGIGYVPQGREIFPQLTVEENILLGLEAAKSRILFLRHFRSSKSFFRERAEISRADSNSSWQSREPLYQSRRF